MAAIENTLYDSFGQRQIATIYAQNAQYRVVLGIAPGMATSPAALAGIYVPAGGIATAAAAVASGPGATVTPSATSDRRCDCGTCSWSKVITSTSAAKRSTSAASR